MPARAAKELGVQHSSVSRRIAAIEAELGESLFVRGRRLTATRLALEIAAHAESLATAALRLSASLAARKARREAQLERLATPPAAPTQIEHDDRMALSNAACPTHKLT